MKTVFMFSGQGAQYAGMGKDLYKNYPVAKEIFDRADNVLGYSIKDICFEDEQKLGETEFAHPDNEYCSDEGVGRRGSSCRYDSRFEPG